MVFAHKVLAASAVVLLTSMLAGCRVSSHGKDGKEDVSIDTPLGGLAVKTDRAAVLGRIGLPQYPGATSVKEKGDDKDSADVNLSFGSFHLRVQAAAFRTGDDRAKVEEFYRKALTQYSDVIACQDGKSIGQPVSTGLGLTCKDDNRVHTHTHHGAVGPELVLKAGSPSRQHLVTLESRDDGTRFGLVALELPHGSEDSKD